VSQMSVLDCLDVEINSVPRGMAQWQTAQIRKRQGRRGRPETDIGTSREEIRCAIVDEMDCRTATRNL
jgi:hypothetical protein